MTAKKGFRTPRSVEDFVSGAATAQTLEQPAPTLRQELAAGQGAAPAAGTVATDLFEPPLNPRIPKQVNFDMPEPEHYALKQLVDSIPKMSLRKFLLEAVREKSDRIRRGEA